MNVNRTSGTTRDFKIISLSGTTRKPNNKHRTGSTQHPPGSKMHVKPRTMKRQCSLLFLFFKSPGIHVCRLKKNIFISTGRSFRDVMYLQEGWHLRHRRKMSLHLLRWCLGWRASPLQWSVRCWCVLRGARSRNNDSGDSHSGVASPMRISD